jgi:hypothetical protein
MKRSEHVVMTEYTRMVRDSTPLFLDKVHGYSKPRYLKTN